MIKDSKTLASIPNSDTQLTTSQIQHSFLEQLGQPISAQQAGEIAKILEAGNGQKPDFSRLQEIYDEQSPELQEFMLHLAILPENIPPQLCNEYLGIDNAEELLLTMAEVGLNIAEFPAFLQDGLRQNRQHDTMARRAGMFFMGKHRYDEIAIGLFIFIPPHITIALQLDKGTHTIKAISIEGEAIFKRQFEVIDKHWAVLGYEYWPGIGEETPPKHFGFMIQTDLLIFQ